MPYRKSRMLNHQYYIHASPETVFDAITNPAVLVNWLSNRAELSLRKGGRYLLGWTDGPTPTGEITELEHGKSIALSWEWPGVSLKGTVLRFSTEPKEGGSILVVEHSGFPRTEEWTDLYGGAE